MPKERGVHYLLIESTESKGDVWLSLPNLFIGIALVGLRESASPSASLGMVLFAAFLGVRLFGFSAVLFAGYQSCCVLCWGLEL